MYKIERKPIVTTNNYRFSRKYPLNMMKVGDTFDFPYKEVLKVRHSVWYWQKHRNPGSKFRVFRVDEETGRCACMALGMEEARQIVASARVWRNPVDGKYYKVDHDGCIFNDEGEEIYNSGEIVEMDEPGISAERRERLEIVGDE